MSETAIPRRARLDKFVPAERAIYDAVQAVEDMPADVRLTDAVILLQAARDSVADFVDGIDKRRFVRDSQPETALRTVDIRLMTDAEIVAVLTARAAAHDANDTVGHWLGRLLAVWVKDAPLAELDAIVLERLPAPLREGAQEPDPRYFNEKGEYLDGPHWGKNCPHGKVQVAFLGANPKLQFSPYSWKPEDHVFIEISIDGEPWRIDIGDYEASVPGGKRRGLHINGPFNLQVDKHSANAADVFKHSAGLREGAAPVTEPNPSAVIRRVRDELLAAEEEEDFHRGVATACNDALEALAAARAAPATHAGPCPHCGLFGNHLSSCEYEKFKALAASPAGAVTEPEDEPVLTDAEIAEERATFEAFMRKRNLSPEVFALVCPWAAGAVPPDASTLDLAPIKAREAAATKGPWRTFFAEDIAIEDADGEWIARLGDEGDGHEANAAFIAHARTDIPALIAEIERLWAAHGLARPQDQA